MPKLLIVTCTGPEDPTRASIPFHIAVNGAAAAGQECAVALAGDATDVLSPRSCKLSVAWASRRWPIF